MHALVQCPKHVHTDGVKNGMQPVTAAGNRHIPGDMWLQAGTECTCMWFAAAAEVRQERGVRDKVVTKL
jgi:hypothetical protein